MNFVAFDFETANEYKDSACEIGIAIVENGIVKEQKSWLIKPKKMYFNPFNVMIHGIDEYQVWDKPEFDVIWEEVRPYLENNYVVAHNVGFDISVLKNTLDTYGLPYPHLKFLCSHKVARRVWPGLVKYDLKTVSSYHNITFRHHKAGDDAEACARILIKAFEKLGLESFDELVKMISVKVGKLDANGYDSSEIRPKSKIKPRNPIVGDVHKRNPEHIFFQKQVVFTGTLQSMTRSEAQKKIADIGGIIDDIITIRTNYLVIGRKDYKRDNGISLSSKQKRTQEFLQKGANIEILSEEDFLRML